MSACAYRQMSDVKWVLALKRSKKIMCSSAVVKKRERNGGKCHKS